MGEFLPNAVDDEHLAVRNRAVEDATVLEVTFDRPEKLNALPSESVTAVIDTLGAVSTETADAVVLTGAGDHFCVGADVDELRTKLREGGADPAGEVHDVVEALRSCPVPVVAAVSGNAFGAGFLFCMAADAVVADTSAAFGLQEVSLGLPVAGYASTLLPRIVGEHRARDWLFTGRTVDATEAETAGFVTRAVPPGEFSAAVDDYVTELASGSALAIELLKARMASPTPATDADDLRAAETDAMRIALEDGDVRERLRELLED